MRHPIVVGAVFGVLVGATTLSLAWAFVALLAAYADGLGMLASQAG